MRFRQRLRELLVLLATLAVVTNLGTGGRDLNVDGVSMGMTYQEVLEIQGPPEKLAWEDEVTALVYSEDRSVWFYDGRVVFCYGLELRDGEKVLYRAGEPAEAALRQFGAFEELTFYDVWFPSSGVVIASYAVEHPEEGKYSERVGLRIQKPTHQPYSFETASRPEVNWTSREPWSNDYRENWFVGAVSLGMSEEEARETGCDAEIVFDGGYVRGIRKPKAATLMRNLGHHGLSVGFKVGRRLDWDIFDYHPDWERKLSPHPNAEVVYDGEIVTSIELYVKDEELFRALSVAKNS